MLVGPVPGPGKDPGARLARVADRAVHVGNLQSEVGHPVAVAGDVLPHERARADLSSDAEAALLAARTYSARSRQPVSGPR